MTKISEKPFHDIEREKLQNHLAAIDRDPSKLQGFIAELYTEHAENPQILYAAATHLIAITYLDQRDNIHQPPTQPPVEKAAKAFTAYTRLMSMLHAEKDAPLYAQSERVRKRLVGTREELAFHAALAYSSAQGADFLALPAPAELDFTGAHEASDVQIFFPGSDTPPLEVQVGYNLQTKAKGAYTYAARIPVLSLANALGNTNKAAELRGLVKDIGDRDDDEPTSGFTLPAREHDILMSASASILTTARAWGAK